MLNHDEMSLHKKSSDPKKIYTCSESQHIPEVLPPDVKLVVETINELPSITQQQWKDQCDVNNIVAKYQDTGELTHVARQKGVYADISQIGDYHQSLQKVMDANSAFMTLPAEVRLRFANDPAQFIAFTADPDKNYDEGVKLGLFEPKKQTQNHIPADTNKRDLNANEKIKQDSMYTQFLEWKNKTKNPDPKPSTPPQEE